MDTTESLARYLWNLALGQALHPALHALEVCFRNQLNRAATKLTASRGFATIAIPSWLDADPSMLMTNERDKVEKAKARLVDPRTHTEGHLVAKLDFGFWVALCRDSYSDTRAAGPRLWPRAIAMAFPAAPASLTTRADIWHRFDPIREYRNRVAHHEPIWDRDYLKQHDTILESIGWMSPKLEAVTRALSPGSDVFARGHQAFRPHAEHILATGPGLAKHLETRLRSLTSPQLTFLATVVDLCVADPAGAPVALVKAWIAEQEKAAEDKAEAADQSATSAEPLI